MTETGESMWIKSPRTIRSPFTEYVAVTRDAGPSMSKGMGTNANIPCSSVMTRKTHGYIRESESSTNARSVGAAFEWLFE